MTIVYFDSSAFVKLVVEEDGSEVAATLWDGCDAAVSSRLAYPEVRAALAAAGRAHLLDPAEQSRAEVLWEAFWAATRAVELTETITAHAGHLASRHALRGADAVHLASLSATDRVNDTSRSTGSNCNDEHVNPVTRLVTFVDIDVGPFAGHLHEDMAADHWAQSEVLWKEGVVADAVELALRAHEVVLSERLLARVGPLPATPAHQAGPVVPAVPLANGGTAQGVEDGSQWSPQRAPLTKTISAAAAGSR